MRFWGTRIRPASVADANPWGWSIAVLAAAATLVLLAGCASQAGVADAPGAGAQPDSVVDEVAAGLAHFYQQELGWGPCAGYPVGESFRAEIDGGQFLCARLSVPLDYGLPDGEAAQIAVIKAPGTGASSSAAEPLAAESLVVNPGGPGSSGLEWALSSAKEVARGPLGGEFDVVSFDPRGVGASTPRIECLGDAEMDAARAQEIVRPNPAGIAESERRQQMFVDACVANTGIDALANIGTRTASRDLDILRAALGDQQLNYLGFSYGTLLGTIYAQQFPGRVRAMVLDGAVFPNEDPAVELVNQGVAFQHSFDEFARDCAQVADCPLGAEPAEAVARYRQLVDALHDAPARTTDPRGLSEADAMTGTIQALYSTTLWGTLRSGLTELAEGRGDSLLLLADIYEGRGDDGRYQSNIGSAFQAIRCVDVQPGFTSEEAGSIDRDYRAAVPFLDDGHGSGRAARDLCDMWPASPTLDWLAEMPDLPRTVVVSTTQDSATPYQAGVDLAQLLDAALITVEGTSHTATFGNECVDEAIFSYLVDLTNPADGPSCPS